MSASCDGSVADVLQSVTVTRRELDAMDWFLVSWRGADGLWASHAASPMTVCGVPLADRPVMITEITDLPGKAKANRLGHVLVVLDGDGAPKAQLSVSGKCFPLAIGVG